MKPGHLDAASKRELGHINTKFYWLTNLKMNVDVCTAHLRQHGALSAMCNTVHIISYNVKSHKEFKVANSTPEYGLESLSWVGPDQDCRHGN